MIDLKNTKKTVIGMIHVPALPGTPNNSLTIKQIIDKVKKEASVFLKSGIDSLMIENMHDVPYLKNETGPEITASMTAIAVELRKMTKKPLGIQILAAANKQALAVAQAARLNYIRAEGFVFGHVADEGFIESCAGELLRYRKLIGAENIAVFTDVKKKHSSHAVTSDVSLAETVKAAEYFLSDGIVITGQSTGIEPLICDVKMARESTSLPVIIGSGITPENIEEFWQWADAFIVGSYFKREGDWKNSVDENRVIKMMKKIQILRDQN